MRQRIKAILPAFFAIPMAYYMVSEPVNIPIMGPIILGYWMLLLVPFMMTAAANATVNNSPAANYLGIEDLNRIVRSSRP